MPIPLALPEHAIVRVVNTERAAHGLPGVRVSLRLSRSAERHSRDQVRGDFLGHDSSDGTPFARRIAQVGAFRAAGEVVAFTPLGPMSSARSVVRLWLNSPGHRRELLNPEFRVIGVGRVRGGLQGQAGAIVTADLARR